MEITPLLIAAIVFVSILCIGLGYLFAKSSLGRQIAQLENDLANSEASFSQAFEEKNTLTTELQKASIQLREKELSETKLLEQLSNAQAAEQRLNLELSEQKTSSKALDEKVEATLSKLREAEKQLESIQSDKRALKDQVTDLIGRLEQATQELKDERTEVKTLKDTLAVEGKKSSELDTANTEARIQLTEIKENFKVLQAELDAQLQTYQVLSKEHTELKTTLERKEEHYKEQMQNLSEAKQSLTKEFENVANKIFEEKGKTFTSTSQASIDNMLKPFREQIEGFQKRVNEVHDSSLKENTNLNAEIKKVLDIGLQMSKEANNLTSALKGDSQQRGAWGEAQLRRTLEMSGLMEEAHYAAQSSFKDADGKQKQTDYLIKLPDGKHIIIDSKVALNAYDRAVGAESPEEYQLAMAEHSKAVRKHIDDLASKDYTNLVGMRSPSFVLMFMPIEPAYIEALKNNKDLFEYGYKKGIVLVSHTTLIPILRTVSNLWMIERSNAEAREISEKAGDIYNSVCIVAERLNSLGGTLKTVSNHYNGAVTALAGQQGLYGKVDRFSQLSSKVSKSLPKLEATHIDYETERLALIVEPIYEPETEPANSNTESSAVEQLGIATAAPSDALPPDNSPTQSEIIVGPVSADAPIFESTNPLDTNKNY